MLNQSAPAQIPIDQLSQIATSAGFAAVGVSPAERATDVEKDYCEWLSQGFHGEMAYLARNFDKRMDPRLLVPGARSVISFIVPYAPRREETPQGQKAGRIASFAWLRDYHVTIKERLYVVLNSLRDAFGPIQGRPFVDSAPLLDRYWAARAGLGWIGKNTLLVTKEWGSYVFIGSLVIDAEVEKTAQPVKDYCGRCNQCIKACPTGALLGPRLIDARKCISYLTIEKKEELSEKEEASLGAWAFGCDECLNACPWNRRIKTDATRLSEGYISREVLYEFTYRGRSLPNETCLGRANPARLRRLLGKSGEEEREER